ncbi:hypothetical protein OIU76_003909 [Salix suchowensis]|nr:hypothetical protein OIU76_003909 [Salix suchowensis]
MGMKSGNALHFFPTGRICAVCLTPFAKADSKQLTVKESHSLRAYIYVLQNCLLAPSKQKEKSLTKTNKPSSPKLQWPLVSAMNPLRIHATKTSKTTHWARSLRWLTGCLKKEGTQNGKAAVKCQTQCQSGKQAEGGVVKTGTLCSSTTGMSTPAPASNAKTSRRSGERKKGLLQRIKDGISGHSDGGGSSSSSSESDSTDDEKCGKRKN